VFGAAGLALGGRMPRLQAAAAQAPSGDAGTLRLADDLFVLRLPGQENIVAYTGANGVVLVDGGAAAAADAVMAAVGAIAGGRPIQTLFNTHWHPEQTGLNETIGKAGKTIIAQENTRLWLTTDVTWPWNGRKFTRLPKIAQPNKTFYATGELPAPADGIRYGHLPDAAHTDGDMYVLFSKQNVLAIGGVIASDGWPVMDWVTGGWIGGLVGALQRVQALGNADTRFVPAHGPVMSLDEVKTQYEMYATIYERLTTLLNRGRSPGEAVEAKPTKEFDAKMGNGDEFVRRSFESLWGYLSPDA
jgi:glyoxylase-like metal-dependent hydrolase (beta-lactamase superfamily II)